ncbi:MAG: insulinase family protein, partial [Ignavibacteriaceae bacterium]|nr:insulinase family protein [Ignavibacteriaceae bacterium]
VFLLFAGCSSDKTSLKVDYEKYKLDNGLEVILHHDNSDPIIAVAIQYHVGSNREVVGRTGFAHLFEHMMFQESQHVGQDQFFKKIQDAGGTLNGGTWNDGTIYYEVVPENSLEMVLWMESDRMGFLLPTVTMEAFKNQQEVVQNEKRQRVDNQPYGHTDYITGKLLYPENHPYNWQVIGSLKDLQNATLKDVHDFYKKWYTPNNATLVLAGSFDKEKAKELVKKYFGELKQGEPVESPKPMPVTLSETKRAYFEDNFAKSPELNMVYPTVEQYNKDSYALDLLGNLLAGNKKAPLYKVIVEEKKLAPSLNVYQQSLELAGTFDFSIRAFPGKNLSDVEAAIFEGLKRFETDKFTEKDLNRVKAKLETNFYNGISSVLGKSFQLAMYNEFAGSPDFITTDLQNTLDVTEADIWNVYEKYIKGKHFILTSFVPKGQVELIASNSTFFPVEEEKITEKSDTASSTMEEAIEAPIASSFDRNIEPAKGTEPILKLPSVWSEDLGKGLKIYGIEQNEVPLVQFNITLNGGMILDDDKKIGVANLISDMLKEGTKNKTPEELEEAIDELGASIRIYTTRESIVLQANALASRFDGVYKLVEEILLEPRWDEKEFARIKDETIEQINRDKANPTVIASKVFNKIVYGENNILGNSPSGTAESIASITIDDLKNYYDKNFSPNITSITIAGDISKEKAVKEFQSLGEKWEEKTVAFPKLEFPAAIEKSKLYFVDVPDAKQSEIRIGYLALPYNHPDYYPAVVMNYKLGGSFSGNVNLILREEKGYTYGARTNFSGSRYPGEFVASAGVQSNATLESAEIFRDEISKYRNGISDEDLAFTKNSLIKSNSRRFETLGALIGMLNNVATYALPYDYVKKEEEVILDMTAAKQIELAQKYLDPTKMVYLVVGDAKTQMERLKKLGFGDPILVDIYGLQQKKN